MASIAANLRTLRNKHFDMEVITFAETMGVEVSDVHNWERGDQAPDPERKEEIKRIALMQGFELDDNFAITSIH